MKALAKASGAEFDRLFLTGMIQHHTGALVMVRDLFATPGAGQDAQLFDFATDVDNTQTRGNQDHAGHAEGEEMIAELNFTIFTPCRDCLTGAVFPGALRGANQSNRCRVNPRASSDDPRVGLKAGLYDAGEAAFGMERLASLPKPPGFDAVTTPTLPPWAPGPRVRSKPPQPPRIQYGSTNSDLAFSGNHLFVGNYNGINFYDIDNPAKTALRDVPGLPGRSGRCIGVRPSAVHVG